MENAKKTYAQAIQNMANQLAAFSHQLEDASAIYNSRQYGPGGADAFTDEELETLEATGGKKLKADDIYSFIILCDQMKTFLNNGDPAIRDYAATVNHIRTDW